MTFLTSCRVLVVIATLAVLGTSCIQDPPYVEPPADSYSARSFQITAAGQTETVRGAEVTPAFFPSTKATPLLGRVLIADEFRPGREAVAVLHHDLWSRVFKSDPAVIGTSIAIDGRPHIIVGIMPRGFTAPAGAQIWIGAAR